MTCAIRQHDMTLEVVYHSNSFELKTKVCGMINKYDGKILLDSFVDYRCLKRFMFSMFPDYTKAQQCSDELVNVLNVKSCNDDCIWI